MGEGDNTKVKGSYRRVSLSPLVLDLLWEAVSTGTMSLEALRCSGPDRRCLSHLETSMVRRHRELRGPSRAKVQERCTWPPCSRLEKSGGCGTKPKSVQKNPGQNQKDPVGVETQVQGQGLKTRVGRGKRRQDEWHWSVNSEVRLIPSARTQAPSFCSAISLRVGLSSEAAQHGSERLLRSRHHGKQSPDVERGTSVSCTSCQA